MCDLNVCALWPGLAYQRNVEGARNVAQLSRNCHVLFCSTDLIFSGNTPPEAGYDEASPPDPLSMIGKTFEQAEQVMAQLPAVLILRKGLPMGPSFSGRKGPLDYLAYRFRQRKPLTLFYDELRSALYIDDFVAGVCLLWAQEATGL
jgi:dTDP-4-dehydrorhamnose reductase